MLFASHMRLGRFGGVWVEFGWVGADFDDFFYYVESREGAVCALAVLGRSGRREDVGFGWGQCWGNVWRFCLFAASSLTLRLPLYHRQC